MSHTFHHLRPRAVLALCLPVVVALLACGEPDAEPVARLTIDESALELPYPEWRSVRLTFEPEEEIAQSGALQVFLHLLDAGGELVRTFDHPLPDRWIPGQAIEYEARIYQSALGPPLDPGTYALAAGLYTAGGERFPLAVAGGDEARVGRRAYRLATVTVPELGSDAPGFAFAAPWGAVESGGDAQILGRRWLEDDGVIRVLNLELPGSVWLRLDIPRTDGSGSRTMALRQASQTPTLEISSSCSGVVRILEAPGAHEEIIPVYPQTDSSECTLRFSANYRLVDASTLREDIAALEIISWTPAEL